MRVIILFIPYVEYLAVFLSSAENKLVLMQIFEDTNYGIRIFFDANNYVQITN